MFEFHPCDRCRYYDPEHTYCRKSFNQFIVNGKYLGSPSKVVHIPDICYKFRYQKEPVITFKDLFEESHSVQLSLF